MLAITAANWTGRMPGENTLLRLAQYDARIRSGAFTIDIPKVRDVLQRQICFWSALAGLIASWWLWPTAVREYCRRHAFLWAMTAGCSAALYILLVNCSREEEWYPIQTLMTDPGSVPIFGHRLLWVWFAMAVKKAMPSLTYVQCYYISQVPPTILTVWMIGRWSALFVERQLQWVGQALVVIMLAVTFDYFTFYDISMIFFVSLCLYSLKTERYFAFVCAMAAATLNHENIVLLVPIAFLQTFRNRRLCLVLVSAALVAHFGVRAALQAAIPLTANFSWRFWTNLYVAPVYYATAAGGLIFWWIAAAAAWKSAGPFLKRAALLLPMLFGITFLMGQFQEGRQFDALIPVTVGFLLSHAAAAAPRLVHPGAGEAVIVTKNS